jgi:primary-amine oxidase
MESLLIVIRPVEIHQLHIKPADFFSQNPSLDVPSSKNLSSKLASCCIDDKTNGVTNGHA